MRLRFPGIQARIGLSLCDVIACCHSSWRKRSRAREDVAFYQPARRSPNELGSVLTENPLVGSIRLQRTQSVAPSTEYLRVDGGTLAITPREIATFQQSQPIAD